MQNLKGWKEEEEKATWEKVETHDLAPDPTTPLTVRDVLNVLEKAGKRQEVLTYEGRGIHHKITKVEITDFGVVIT